MKLAVSIGCRVSSENRKMVVRLMLQLLGPRVARAITLILVHDQVSYFFLFVVLVAL